MLPAALFLYICHFLHLTEIPTVMTSPIFWFAFRQATSIPVSYQLMLHFVHTSTDTAHLTFDKMTRSSFHAPKSSLLESVRPKLPYECLILRSIGLCVWEASSPGRIFSDQQKWWAGFNFSTLWWLEMPCKVFCNQNSHFAF